jgi:hypothetical protein
MGGPDLTLRCEQRPLGRGTGTRSAAAREPGRAADPLPDAKWIYPLLRAAGRNLRMPGPEDATRRAINTGRSGKAQAPGVGDRPRMAPGRRLGAEADTGQIIATDLVSNDVANRSLHPLLFDDAEVFVRHARGGRISSKMRCAGRWRPGCGPATSCNPIPGASRPGSWASWATRCWSELEKAA